jgi:uncharacterized Ntn-hydrolase superfamily protein
MFGLIFNRRVVLASLLLVPVLPRPARATWSIVVFDRARRWIGVAAASCTPDVYGIMSLRPGEGVLIAQAVGNDRAIQRANQLLAGGAPPDSALRAATAPALDSASWYRQYAAATFAGGVAQFTGDSTARYHGERRADDVLVQGNSLAGPAVLDRVMDAIKKAQAAGRPIQEVLMAGLAAGSKAGGDVRCGTQRATSAFLVVARPGEKPYLPYLTLSVFRAEPGTVNAVEVLATRLARWAASGGAETPITSEGVQPAGHPASGKPGGAASKPLR